MGILPFEKLIEYNKLLFMHSIHYDYAPSSFRNIFQKIRNADAYTVPAAGIELFKKFPLFTFPIAWNSVGILAYFNNPILFQRALKEEIFSYL